jgi:hypothetical protein
MKDGIDKVNKRMIDGALTSFSSIKNDIQKIRKLNIEMTTGPTPIKLQKNGNSGKKARLHGLFGINLYPDSFNERYHVASQPKRLLSLGKMLIKPKHCKTK